MRLKKVVLLKEIPLRELITLKDEDRFGPGTSDVFASPTFLLDREGDMVSITGPVGTVIEPWSNVHYAVPDLAAEVRPPEVKPVVSAGKAGKR